jgi:hypothetical protein
MQNLFRRSLAGNLVLLLVFLAARSCWTQGSSSRAAEIANLQPTPLEQQPRYGTFWSLQRTNTPPLPYNPFPNLPVYWLNKDRNVFLIDDRSVDYEALYQQRLAARILKAAALGMSLEEMESLESCSEAAAYDFTTNDLWLEIITVTNSTAALVIHPPWDETNVVHDLFYSTNLASPTNWHFLMRTTTTNVLVPDMCDQQGFFRLGRTNGDLTVTTNVTPQQMAQLLVPPWVTVTNARFTGADVARGIFAGGHGCGLPLESGVILSSGDIGLAVGTNDSSLASSNNEELSDTDLDRLVGNGLTANAAVLEFDIVPTNLFVLRFQYIFNSEEYPEYIGNYNDPMAIFVSTNQIGTNWIIDATNNIALVPGTDQPISVSFLNGGFEWNGLPQINPSNPRYYVDNEDPDPGFSAMPPYASNASAFNIQYDGMTVLLSAHVPISPNITTHIKIGIEDYGDVSFDSAVFLKRWELGSCCQCQ